MKPKISLDAIGTTIAKRYVVHEVLGRGGMAVVYRVRDQRTGADVALKRSFSSDPVKRQRHDALLEREYYTLTQLAHPRIIAAYDYGVDSSGPYYTMELLDGRNLETDERIPWQRTCALLCDVASSVAMLHSRGLVHRDVSTRNVHCTSDGRAKLIDFGAMMAMTVAKDVVGTPPFMAPEVLQLQALDGRADLFSIGALGYRLLTGRHAFPAKRLSELRDAWRSRPTPPTLLVPDLPPELSALILQLLTLDRGGRPQRAAEVIERLRSIADLKLSDTEDISRAYLSTPTLVGRDAALLHVRKRVLGVVRGDGGLMLVRGESGVGRSRMLDACALEGKLLGVVVVRADRRDSSHGEWGVARALAAQLMSEFPQQAVDAARLSRSVLSYVIDEFRDGELRTATGYTPERSVLVRELRDWILSLSKLQRLLLVVDDADRIDDSSAALLSTLAYKAERHPLLIALAVGPNAGLGNSAAQNVLHDLGDCIDLEPLQPQETEALTRSLFGDVPNLPLCSTRIHTLSHGNPRAALELAQYMVDAGLARYEAGTWALPTRLEETDLPTTRAAQLAARLDELSEDAREIADVLALADQDALQVATYPSLTEHRQVKRVFHALNELVAARVLIADTDSARYMFTQRGFVAVLQEVMTKDRRMQLHRRIARLLATTGGNLLRRAHHLFASGADAEGVQLLSRADIATLAPSTTLLATAIQRAEQLGVPAATLHRLRVALILRAPMVMDFEVFSKVVPLVLKQLESDSGLGFYQQLSHLPPQERFNQALVQTQQRYSETPEQERVHNAFEAIRELARVSGAIASAAVLTFDSDLLDALPQLDPLFSLSPALPLVSQVQESAKLWVQGRLMGAYHVYAAIRARISEPDRAGLDEAQWDRTRFGIEHMLGVHEAMSGNEMAEQRAKTLESHREYRVNAWRVRALLELSRGDTESWRKCTRRAQLLQAQGGLNETYSGGTVGIELALHHRLGDMLGAKSLLRDLADLAAKHESWRAVELMGRAAYNELNGDLDTALDCVERGLALARPLHSPFYTCLAACHLSVLLRLRRNDEAARYARTYINTSREYDLDAWDVERFGALALARTNDHEGALKQIESSMGRAERWGSSGYALGAVFETAALIAVELRDRERFEMYFERASREFEKAQNPSVMAKLTRLHEAAVEHGLRLPDVAVLTTSLTPNTSEGEDTIHSRIAECVDAADRGRCALTMLMQETVSAAGMLYAIQSEQSSGLELLAALPEQSDDPGLERWLQRFASEWTEASESEGTVSGSGDTTDSAHDAGASHRYIDRDHRRWQLVPLSCQIGETRVLAGVFVAQLYEDAVVTLPPRLTASIASELLDYGDSVPRHAHA